MSKGVFDQGGMGAYLMTILASKASYHALHQRPPYQSTLFIRFPSSPNR